MCYRKQWRWVRTKIKLDAHHQAPNELGVARSDPRLVLA